MSKADELFEKLIKMDLGDLLILCGNAIKTELNEEKLSVILQILEMRLQKRSMAKRLGLKYD